LRISIIPAVDFFDSFAASARTHPDFQPA
jgi:hypothetical protein